MAITNLGVTAFNTIAPPVWSKNGQGLDVVTLAKRGAASALDNYLGTLNLWTAYPGDNAMFLSSWSNDDDKQYPTVTLQYIGFRGGTFPAPVPADDVAFISASYSNADATLTVKKVRAVYHVENGDPPSDVLSLFDQVQVTTSRTTEVVPSRYWQHDVTTFIALEPDL